MTANTLRIPISNVYGGGDYTAQIALGSQQTKANVILDTGSSTLAVKPSGYDVAADRGAAPTAFAQDIIYGTGGWTGPVVQTKLAMGVGDASVSLDAYVAVCVEEEPGNFGQADGILGLAYNVLNSAYDLSSYLTEQGHHPAVTHPWPFPVSNSSAAIRQFAKLLGRMPDQDLPPYFSALTSAGVEKNLFAFYTLRSLPSLRSAQWEDDPLNHGFFIMGGGIEQNDLFRGEFVSVAVVDDLYYNTDLVGVQVGDRSEIAAQQLPAKYAKTMGSNSIVDSGTNSLALSADVWTAIMSSLKALNPAWTTAIQAAATQPPETASLHLENWPDITFILRGTDGQPVRLACSPSTYWQADSPQAGQAVFLIGSSSLPQSILGLPLMNNYYTVFDRTLDPYGAVRFAPITPAG